MPKRPFLAQILLVLSLLTTIKTPFSDALWAEIDEIKIDFSQKRHPYFCSFGYNYSRRLLPLWVRSAFALGSFLRMEAKWIQNGMKKAPSHHLSICRKNLFFCFTQYVLSASFIMSHLRICRKNLNLFSWFIKCARELSSRMVFRLYDNKNVLNGRKTTARTKK